MVLVVSLSSLLNYRAFVCVAITLATFAALGNTPLHTHKLNILLIIEAIIKLAILMEVMSISTAKVAFLMFRDFIVSSTSCGDVGEIKKNESKSFISI